MATLATRIRSHLPRGHHGCTATPYVALDRRLCEACWRCVEVCPNDVLGTVEFGSHRHAIVESPDDCTGCLSCVRACRSEALTGRSAA